MLFERHEPPTPDLGRFKIFDHLLKGFDNIMIIHLSNEKGLLGCLGL